MTKFVTAVIVVAFTVVFSTAAMAEGWRIGNWEPPKKEQSPVSKTVSLGQFVQVPPAPIAQPVTASCVGAQASCVGLVQVMPACAIQPARACSGRSVNVNGRWFPGRRMLANRQARAQARMGCN